jgi:hypothetical protein
MALITGKTPPTATIVPDVPTVSSEPPSSSYTPPVASSLASQPVEPEKSKNKSRLDERKTDALSLILMFMAGTLVAFCDISLALGVGRGLVPAFGVILALEIVIRQEEFRNVLDWKFLMRRGLGVESSLVIMGKLYDVGKVLKSLSSDMALFTFSYVLISSML